VKRFTGIDAHFWYWVLWLRSKEERGKSAMVRSGLRRLHDHVLAPLGAIDGPTTIAQAVAIYRTHRHYAEHRFQYVVSRRLEAEVAPAL
jgi:hypothetical protein